jgi:hypothetical protein
VCNKALIVAGERADGSVRPIGMSSYNRAMRSTTCWRLLTAWPHGWACSRWWRSR